MIYIQEKTLGSDSIVIKVDGVLNYKSVQILKEILIKNGKTNKQLVLQLGGITHVDRFGKDLLWEYRDKVVLKGLPDYLQSEINLEAKSRLF